LVVKYFVDIQYKYCWHK